MTQSAEIVNASDMTTALFVAETQSAKVSDANDRTIALSVAGAQINDMSNDTYII